MRLFSSLAIVFEYSTHFKIYLDRNEDNIWGNVYKKLSGMTNWQETAQYGFPFSGEILLYLGWGVIIFGLCLLLLGK
jgi:hypothetical protein